MPHDTLTPLAKPVKFPGSRRETVVDLGSARRTRLDLPSGPPQRLHAFFERVCARTPDAVAIDFVEAGERLTYAQLDARSAQLAHHLVRLGVVPNDRVALHLPRGVEPFVALLGVLRAGAAYVPIDVETPAERARFTVEDSGAKLVLTTTDLAGRFAGTPCLTLAEIAARSIAAPKGATLPQTAAEDLCYLIYTSGTTGRPKGVCLSHQNAVAFVQGMLDVYGVRADDRVLQGFSTAFDASVEEVWMAFATGATLVVGTQQTMRAVDELPAKLRSLGVTVFSTVPTLLGVLDADDQPQLRLLILGGEAARADVIEKWTAPGRRILNSYGPTETTVVATYAWCVPGMPVTIGKPLPGYEAVVVDEALQPVADGVEGELCVGGPGVSVHGYLNRPDLNSQKFIALHGRRFYRTGDLVCRDFHGDLLFRGRIDAQVKIRGYRVELEEIESHIARALEQTPDADAFQGCIVTVQDTAGPPQLVAYVVQRRPAPLDVAALVASLRRTLPPYMVPTHFAALAPVAVPRLPSGKTDRKRLPPMTTCRTFDNGRTAPSRNTGRDAVEQAILTVWRDVLGHHDIDRDDSFFDLGGNSMLAAQSVTRFRHLPELTALTIRDLYECLSAAALAARLRERAPTSADGPVAVPRQQYRAPRRQFLAVATAQTLVILTLLCGGGFVAYGMLYALYHLYLYLSAATPYWFAVMVVGGILFAPVGFAAPLVQGFLVKRLLVGRCREGAHAVWSWGYFRWWLSNLLLAPQHRLAAGFVGTPLAPFFYRLLGARIGKHVYLGTALHDPDLVTIEDGASISEFSNLGTHGIEDGVLHLRRVHVGKNAFVGAQAIVSGGARLGDGAKLHPLSCLVEGTVAPAGTEWRGSPAVLVESGTTALSALLRRLEQAARPQDAWRSTGDALRFGVLQFLYSYALSLIEWVPFALEIALLYALGVRPDSLASVNLAVLVPASFAFAALRFFGGLGTILAAKWLLTGRARPGTVALNSHEYVRRWFCGRLMALLVSPHGYRPLTETLLMPIFCRWLGMKVGRHAEIADALGFQPDLVSLGEGAMLADSCVLGAPIVHRGLMSLGRVHIGDRSFIGNGAHMPITTPNLGADSLVGVLSLPPDAPAAGSDWLGSPPMRLPNRQRWSGPAAQTFNPPARLFVARALCNAVKMVLPGALLEIVFWITLKLGLVAHVSLGALYFLPLLPLLVLGATFATLALPVVLKWLLIGRYRAGQQYLWSFWMWRMETVYDVEILVNGSYTPLLSGTPWLPMLYRAVGARIGRQVCILGGLVLEGDLTTLGDHASLEGVLQTHLFEDRVMKLGTVHVEDGASIGTEAYVLYDSHVGAGASLSDLSLCMKQETFLPGHRYRGLPAENVEGAVSAPAAARRTA